VDQVIKYIRRFDGVRGVVHSFAGSEQQAHKLLDLGFLISLGGPLTYERAHRLHRVVQSIPLTGLMLETDAPDQPGCQHRGERNEPAYLPEVLETVARLRDEDPAHIAAVTTANARRLFGLAA
jgi:TatD DNase family protein